MLLVVLVPAVSVWNGPARCLLLLEDFVFIRAADLVTQFAREVGSEQVLDVVLEFVGVVGLAMEYFAAGVVVDRVEVLCLHRS